MQHWHHSQLHLCCMHCTEEKCAPLGYCMKDHLLHLHLNGRRAHAKTSVEPCGSAHRKTCAPSPPQRPKSQRKQSAAYWRSVSSDCHDFLYLRTWQCRCESCRSCFTKVSLCKRLTKPLHSAMPLTLCRHSKTPQCCERKATSSAPAFITKQSRRQICRASAASS